ncbi:ubiquinone biosynthesis protein COQ9 [Sphingomonas zeicaulis]|uniref:COQ9 family protein n=1 Tax=Sphingomonas zeicaulis TaxID=1632740 RepID=UPI003D220421
MVQLPTDPTLDELRDALAPLIARHAAFDGWTLEALAAAAEEAGVDPKIAALAYPGGAVNMIDAWFGSIDLGMLAAWPAETLGTLKIRARIQSLVEARIALLAPHREALRRALAVLALPTNAPRAARLGWRAADAIWRAAGDAATDYNHYTKRAMLLGVYASTMLVLVDDESEDLADTHAFLGRRIDDVMRIEKTKAGFKARSEHRLSLTRFIGRLRYPAL